MTPVDNCTIHALLNDMLGVLTGVM